MKYPAVFRDTNTSSSGDSNQQTVLIYQDGDAIHLAGKFKGQYTTHWSTFNAINITKEYLQNTYGEVQSPEHAGIIIELAKNAGFEFGSAKPDLEAVKSFMIYSDCFDVYSFDVSELSNESNRKQITIPLPPKSDKQELSEWPQVGDEAVLVGDLCTVMSPADGHGTVAVTNEKGFNLLVFKSDLSKPKTPEEEWLDNVMERAKSMGLSAKDVEKSLLSVFKKKPQ
jgi:hypothetical protein